MVIFVRSLIILSSAASELCCQQQLICIGREVGSFWVLVPGSIQSAPGFGAARLESTLSVYIAHVSYFCWSCVVNENISWAGAFCLFVFGLLSGTVTSLCLNLPEYRVALRICIRVFERECGGRKPHCNSLPTTVVEGPRSDASTSLIHVS